MNILVILLIVIISIIALFLIIALFIRHTYHVERDVEINKPKQEVFNYVKYIKNQESYNKWVMMDPDMRRNYIGTDGAPGFVSTWDSDNKNVGKGEQEIKGITEGEKLNLEVRFEKPFKNIANISMITQALQGNKTKVKWRMEGKNSYPMNLMNLFIPGMLGKDLAISLTNLKAILEK